MKQRWLWGMVVAGVWLTVGWGEPAPSIETIDTPAKAQAAQAAWAAYLSLPVERTGAAGIKFRLIPPGRFLMGSGEADAPLHWVTISKPFYMGATEVTQAQFKAVTGKVQSDYDAGPERPINDVTWYHIQGFLRVLKKQEAEAVYRLPTEAEWEYAARAGVGTEYPGGNRATDLARVGWFVGNSGGATHPVGQLAPNAFGLYDMLGNAWEWCSDFYDPNWYKQSDRVDPTGPTNSLYQYLAMRGGSAYYGAALARLGNRSYFQSSRTERTIGFRLVLAIPSGKGE